MNLATVLGLTAILEGAAAIAGWVGGCAYAAWRPARRAAAWRHVTSAVAAVALAIYTYFLALVMLGRGAVVSGRDDAIPTAEGLLVLAIGLGLAAGVPWGMFRHADARAELRAGGRDDREFWPVARRVSSQLFLPFAIVGLVIFAPRARGGLSDDAALGAGAIAIALVALAAVAFLAFRSRGPILALGALCMLIGVPLLTALMALTGVSLATAFVASGASALVWAPAMALAIWNRAERRQARGIAIETARVGDDPAGGARSASSPARHRTGTTRRRQKRR